MVIKTPAQAIKSNTLSVGKLKSQYGDTSAKAFLVDILADFIEFINVGKNFNGSQVAQTVQMIQQYFPHLNLADLKLFFDKMKLGHFGSFFDRMDGQLILEKMEKYDQERMNEFEMIKIQQHKEQIKNEPIGEGYHPDVIQALKNAIGDKKVFVSEVKEPKTQTEAELWHQRALKQFDNLFIKFGEQKGLRRLKIGKTILTIDAFIQRKVENSINKSK